MSQFSLFSGQEPPASCEAVAVPHDALNCTFICPIAPVMDHDAQKEFLGLSALARTGDDYSASWLVYGQDILLEKAAHGEQVDWLGICAVALLVLKTHPRQLGVTPMWAVPAIGLRISGGELSENSQVIMLLEKAKAHAVTFIGRSMRIGIGTGGNPSPLDCIWTTAACDETRTIVRGVRA